MTKDGDAPLEQLMQVLGHSFGDPDLLRTALTHPSALTRRTGRQGPRQKGGQDNQRLEFLGDRVLGLVVAEMLYRTSPRSSGRRASPTSRARSNSAASSSSRAARRKAAGATMRRPWPMPAKR